MKLFFSILFFFSLFQAQSQTVVYGIKTSKAQENLIDELVEVSNFKKALIEAANIRVYVKAMEANKLKKDSITKDDASRILKNIYENYNYKEKYYTEFASLPEKNLRALVKLFKSNPEIGERGNYIFCPTRLFHNLENDIEHEIKGLSKNKN